MTNPNPNPEQDPNPASPEVSVSPEVLDDLESWIDTVDETLSLIDAAQDPNANSDPTINYAQIFNTLGDGTTVSTIKLSRAPGRHNSSGDIQIFLDQKVDENRKPTGQASARIFGFGSQLGLSGEAVGIDGTTNVTLERDDIAFVGREGIEVIITPNDDDDSERVELISELDDENSYLVNPDYDPWVGNEKYLKLEKPVSVADRIAKKMDVKNSRLWKAISTRYANRQARNNGGNQPQDGPDEPDSELKRNIKGSIATVPAAAIAAAGIVVLGKFGYGLVSNPEKAINLANNGVIEKGKELLGDPWNIVVGLGRTATTGAFFAGAATGLLGDAQLVDNPFAKLRKPRWFASHMPAKAMTWIERGEPTDRSETAAKRRVTWALGAAANFALLGNGLPGVAYGFGALSGRIAGRTLQRFGPGAYKSLLKKIEGGDEEQIPDDQTGPTPNQPQSPPPPAANDQSPPNPGAGTPPKYDPPRRRPGGRLIGEPAPATGDPAPNADPAVGPTNPRDGRNSRVM